MTAFGTVTAVTADSDSVSDTVGIVFSVVTAVTSDTDRVADTVVTDCL